MLIEQMQEKAEERDKRHPLVFVINGKEDKVGITKQVYMGITAFTAVRGKERWLQQRYIRTPFGFQQTITDLTRDWTEIAYKLPIRRRKQQLEEAPIKPQPIFARPTDIIEEGIYFDLKKAYWNIFKLVGFDVEYIPNKYLAVSKTKVEVPQFLADDRIFRSTVVTMARGNHTKTIYNPIDKTYSEVKSINKFSQPLLPALVNDVLHAIAAEMRLRTNVLYVNTDGYIIDAKYEKEAREVLDSWKLPYAVKGRGKTKIFGTASYTVGEVGSVAKNNGAGMDNLTPINNWLKSSLLEFYENNEYPVAPIKYD